MDNAINIAQIMVSTALVMLILLQVREIGSGLFGSGQSSFRVRRGLEKVMFQFTIFLALVFVVVSIISVRST